MVPRAAKRTAGRAFVPPPPPRTPKAEFTRRRILNVAMELFTERGYSAVSMRDLAASAGLTKGAVYGHFRSKGQLLVEVIRWRLAEQDEATDYDAAVADPRHGVELMFDERGRQLRMLEVDAAAAARHDPDVEAGLGELYRDRHQRIREATSEVPDPETVAWIIAALSAGIGMKESVGMPLPPKSRLAAGILAAVEGMS
jgi:AcrR family transcriptional regulator